mmetsp:Transcript_12027/g.28611  ORF Transcript_12027/g.28611 Transcript_12027/m.28611 type:complete len:205 (+) Transcript_12027:643-1257(+)
MALARESSISGNPSPRISSSLLSRSLSMLWSSITAIAPAVNSLGISSGTPSNETTAASAAVRTATTSLLSSVTRPAATPLCSKASACFNSTLNPHIANATPICTELSVAFISTETNKATTPSLVICSRKTSELDSLAMVRAPWACTSACSEHRTEHSRRTPLTATRRSMISLSIGKCETAQAACTTTLGLSVSNSSTRNDNGPR